MFGFVNTVLYGLFMVRLARNDWLDHALTVLAAEGFTSLKADTLAKSLGVSRGSFYWHFEDLASFHEAVLDRWLEASVLTIVEKVEAEGTEPAERLRLLVEIAASGDRRLEQAVRAWAFNDAKVSDVVATVDKQRLDYITELLWQMKVKKRDINGRALLLYLTSVGYCMISEIEPGAERAVIESILESASAR